jgi:hypothetical protein
LLLQQSQPQFKGSKLKPIKRGMANYWAIAIGINQYQLFPALSFAQADAEALRDFLVTQAGFLPQNCLLMGNADTDITDENPHPTKSSILSLLEELAAKSWLPGDLVWLFFSGYGINYQGKDYLMSAEANPDLVGETGIEVALIMQTLQVVGLNVLLILDINRPFGTQADDPVGEEIIELAKELQIATILSCAPEEFSHETSELGHGVFTSVLLSALQSGAGRNLTDLANYLSSVTPKTCQQHWLPVQNPVVVMPFQPQEILPDPSLHKQPELYGTIFPEESFAVAGSASGLGNLSQRSFSTTSHRWTPSRTVETTLSKTPLDQQEIPENLLPISEFSGNSATENPVLLTNTEVNTNSTRYIPSLTQIHTSSTSETKIPIWQQFLLWGGSTMAVVGLIASFFLCHHQLFRWQKSATSSDKHTDNQKQIGQSTPVNNVKFPANAVIPQTQNSPNSYLNLSISDTQRQQAISELNKMSLTPVQGMNLRKALDKAEKIPSSAPSYAKSQENIQIWQQMILELAVRRVKHREYNQAITTAKLIHQNESFYPQTQSAIEEWRLEHKQYVSNKTVLDAANALIVRGQASTYNRAIDVAQKVTSGEPGFDLAQKSINRWSEKILDLAKSRAAHGQFVRAMQTASLVPSATVAYHDAQDAMQKWQAKIQHN